MKFRCAVVLPHLQLPPEARSGAPEEPLPRLFDRTLDTTRCFLHRTMHAHLVRASRGRRVARSFSEHVLAIPQVRAAARAAPCVLLAVVRALV